MSQDIKEKLHDGSFRVIKLGRHDGKTFTLPKPIEYDAKCLRIATAKKSDNWHDTADQWLITINKEVFEYYTGKGHRKNGKPQKPEFSSVLGGLVWDASACDESFDDWCSSYGYDTDSRKALDLYLACQGSAAKLRKAGIYISTELREFFQNY